MDAISTLSEKWIDIQVELLDTRLIIKFTDSGSGIPRAIHNRLMEPFFTTKELGKGTGLGLSICKGIVEAHGGTIELNNSSPNTQFVVSFPTIALSKPNPSQAA